MTDRYYYRINNGEDCDDYCCYWFVSEVLYNRAELVGILRYARLAYLPRGRVLDDPRRLESCLADAGFMGFLSKAGISLLKSSIDEINYAEATR